MHHPTRYAFALAALAGSALPAFSAPVIITGSSSQPVRVITDNSADAQQMGKYLTKYLNDRHCAAALVKGGVLSPSYHSAQLVLVSSETQKTHAPGTPTAQFAAKCRDEAYQLNAASNKNTTTVMLIGKASVGIRAAASRFICKLVNDGRQLSIAAGKEQADPFIKIRIANPGNSARRQTPFTSPFKTSDLETWPLSKLRAYPEMFWQFGFNGF